MTGARPRGYDPAVKGARWSLLLAAALFLCALGPAGTSRAYPGPEETEDAATPRWDQFGGNSARTFASAVEPVRSTPRTSWKGWCSPEDAGNIVAWEGTLLLASGSRGGSATLEAFSLADGRRLAKHNLGSPGNVRIAVARGMVIVAGEKSLRGFQLQGSGFTQRWSVKGCHPQPPAVIGDTVCSYGGGILTEYEPMTGKPTDAYEHFATECPPALARENGTMEIGGVVTGPLSGYEGVFAFLRTPSRRGGSEFGFFRNSAPGDLHLCRIPRDGTDPGGWLLYTSSALAGKDSDLHASVLADHGRSEGGGLAPLASPPTVYGGQAIGFGEDGTLVAVRAKGTYAKLVDLKDLPPGTRPGPASRARNVAYFGNWALDLDTRRVLWSLPDFKPGGPLLPVADRVLIAVSEKGDLLCLTDRPEAGSAAAAPRGPGPAVPPPPPPLPGDGLLLDDGTSVEGSVEALPGGRFRVLPPGGAAREEEAARLLFVRGGGRVLHRGRESGVLARWRRTLHPPAVDDLMAIHIRMAKDGLHEAAAAVLSDARALGLPEDRAAEAARRAGAVKANAFPERVLAGLEPEFLKARSRAREGILAASDWCLERGFPAAAACLLLDAARLLRGDGVPDRRAAAGIPAVFPWKDSPDAGRRWLEWAREIVDADAEFLPADHILRKSITSGPWAAGEEVVVLRTPNVVFRSRIRDPAIVGRCLRNAEFVCRALAMLLGPGALAPVRDDQDRMDVRLHADEESFREEDRASGDAPAWSAGHYSPGEGVSLFFVPGEGRRDPLGRGLFEVLAHELTHHFLDRRWSAVRGRPRGGPGAPGYWAIEGIARFVEDQAVEMERRGLRFDDRTVPSLEAAAQAAGRGVLFRPSELLAMSHRGFRTLPDTEILRVRLRNTIEQRILSPVGLFYEQAGATAYHLVMDRGEEGRRAFFRYLADVYAGKAAAEGWRVLGFASAEVFDEKVQAFLAGLR